MKTRRDVMPLIAGGAAAVAWPFTVSAEPATKRPLIAWLSGGSQKASWVFVEAFLQGMRAALALVLTLPTTFSVALHCR